MFFLKYVKKSKLIIISLLILISSLNGILLSSIIIKAGKFNQTTKFKDILLFGIGSLIFWAIVYLSNYLFDTVRGSIIKDINIQLKQGYFLAEYLESTKSKDHSEILSVLSNDFRLIENNYLEPIFIIFSSILLFIVSLGYMLYLNIFISLIFIAFSVIPIIIPKLMEKYLREAANNYSIANVEYSNAIKEIFSGFLILKTYFIKKEIIELSKSKLFFLELSTFNLKKVESFAKLLSALISGFCFIVPFVIGCYFILHSNNLSFSVLIGIFLANDKVIGPIQAIAISLNKISTTKDLREKYFKFLDHDQFSPRDESDSLLFPEISEIRFKEVKYNMSNGDVLNFSLILKKPFRILIIGKSGSGKTTLFNLISGAIPLTMGKILYVGKDGEEVRNKFVPIVYQTPHIFDTTVRNNITLFQNELYDDDMLKMILRKINLYDELESNGLLEFECGENGYKLSGGQKQKIALARALVRNRDIYLFDEISANLDKENSRQIHNLLFDLDISFIEIAHHYDVSDNRYTNIYSLENGQLNQIK